MACEKCMDTGWVETNGFVRKCICQRKVSKEVIKALNIPKRYEDVSLENFLILSKEHKKALSIVKSYIELKAFQKGNGLMFVGPPGTGKTHLAVSIIKEIYTKYGIKGYFINTISMLFEVKKLYEERKSENSLLKEILEVPILVLDDLGNERLSEWSKDIIHYIISNRYNDMKPIIITSNSYINTQNDLPSLEERLSPSIISRIKSTCKLVEIKGTDIRSKGKEFLEKVKQLQKAKREAEEQ
ncbi:MAG: ATP-binding protein [Aquificae bacterium]|nr:ATP-binding protein [Aquificota bacterium]